MKVEDIVGTFSIIGSNQDKDENSYKGELILSLDENNRIIAKWIIDNSQKQYGTGFFKNNVLVINFNYKGIDEKKYKGTVVYRCLNQDIFEGFWSEEYGNPEFLGAENCFRIKDSKTILN